MLKSYLKTTLRTIRRSPLASFINIFGLAMALGVAIMVYAFVDMEYTTDQFHENKNDIYMATSILNRSGEDAEYGIVPAPYAEVLINDFPQIKRVVRVDDKNGILKNGPSVFNESFTFADPGFLDMFTFPLKWGNKSALSDPNKIILSENTSIKYFGDKNPLGEPMTFEFGSRKYTFEVAGVAEKFPYQRTMDFSVLVNFDQLKQVDTNVNLTDWARFLDATFIQLDDPSAIANITQNVQQYVALQNEVRKDYPATSFRFFPWTDLYQKGDDMRNTITGSTDGIGTLVLSIIAGFILVLAIFNYINIAIVSATKRLKEIGVRKVMGSTRKSLIIQFLAENVFLTLVALVFGFILGVTVLIPGFDQMFDIGMDFDISQPSLWVFLLVLVVFTGLASGAYPALYISNFSAVHIFRGRLKFGGKNKMTKIFLTFQYILACIAVVGGIMFTQNTAFQKNQDWGYNEKATISANISPATEAMQLMAAMESNINIVSIAPSKHHLSRRSTRMEIQILEKDYDILTLEIGPEYVETMELELFEGRTFEKNRETDFQNVLINEQMAKLLNPEGALGERFKSDTLNFAVIGILKDFHQYNFSERIEPMILKLSPEDEYAFVSMRVKPGTIVSTYEAMEKKWAELFPEKPFNGFYQEATLEGYFREMDGHGKLMRIVASMCIILSCLGLYGLVSLNVASRTKEFSIRKALGAGLGNLAFVINKQFVIFLAVALILGLPVSYVLMDTLFETVYEVHKPITIFPFLIALVIVVIMVFSTVSSQVKKVMTTSPTEGLRSE
ncbi:FtsX-like permease family protein [Roseivirga sp.]|uniref:ABC transporter permease n=1 Tax=Roseivirga sp. TaxID=1964215 RepID=UPI003B8E8A2D